MTVSFLLDPPILVAAGAAIERGPGDEGVKARAGRAFVVLTVGVSAALYANVPGLGAIWRPFRARSGRDFMLGSGLAHPEARMRPAHHALALSLFAAYPAWLALGRRLARRP